MAGRRIYNQQVNCAPLFPLSTLSLADQLLIIASYLQYGPKTGITLLIYLSARK